MPLYRINDPATSRWSRPRRWRLAGRVRSGVSIMAGSTSFACGTSPHAEPDPGGDVDRAARRRGRARRLLALQRGERHDRSDDSPANHSATLLAGVGRVAGGPLAPARLRRTLRTSRPRISRRRARRFRSPRRRPATGSVSYSATGACPCTDVFSAAVGTTHVIALSGLAANTTYTFAVKAHDAADNLQTAGALTFHTLAVSADVTAPVVTSRVRGRHGGRHGDGRRHGLRQRRRRQRRVPRGRCRIGPADVQAPYSAVWDSAGVADGAHR